MVVVLVVIADYASRCTYHAWKFDSDGKCLSIPQSDKSGKDEKNPKACAKVYPTQVRCVYAFPRVVVMMVVSGIGTVGMHV